MKIALYYRHIDPDAEPCLQLLTEQLHRHGIETCELRDGSPSGAADGCDFLFSIGGDGTLLSSIQFIGSDAPGRFPPVLGINFGHLGFLTTVGRDNLHGVAESLLNGDFSLEERTLLQLSTTRSELPTQYALNEVFLHRTEEASLLKTEVYVNGDYVATYAGDGVIVATPTGSTAYSLSCGGPILTPDSRCLLVTPISAHTLTLRPIIIPDTADLRLRVGSDCFLGRDSSRTTLGAGTEVHLRRAPFSIRLVRLGHQNFYSAIREKLMWGTEVRG